MYIGWFRWVTFNYIAELKISDEACPKGYTIFDNVYVYIIAVVYIIPFYRVDIKLK